VALRRKGTEPGVNEILFDASKVDLVGEPADRSVVELYIVADIPWSGSDAQIRSLQDKLHAYVSYALDGQMVQMYPELSSRPWRIVIRCLTGPPDPRTADVLSRTVERLHRYGGDLEVRV
jgi:hypothetical protein